MARTSKITRNETGYFVPTKNLRPVQAPKDWTALLLAALVLAVFGAFSSAAQAQEARPDLFGHHPANLSKIVVVGDSLSAGFQSCLLYTSRCV